MCNYSKNDNLVPGGVYLCQVDAVTSCGACCGLYNVPNISRVSLSALLERRTVEFAATLRNLDALDDFAHQETQRLKGPQPVADFHHCPFVGFVGSNQSRVGCLLHPLAEGNNGVDYRGLSYYGGMACRDYFCPATRTLPPELKQILRRLDLDWYAYGLIVTEAALNQALFNEIIRNCAQDRIFEYLQQDRSLTLWCQKLFTLKLTWPYRNHQKSLCHYLFEDGIHQRSEIDCKAQNTMPSGYATILRELDSYFESEDDLQKAVNLIAQMTSLP